MKPFILASASPRRREILKKLGYNFVIEPSDIVEEKDLSLTNEKIAESLACQKAEDVFKRRGDITVGADTIVVLNGEILGKPKDRAQNKDFLERLSGNVHTVITGYCVITPEETFSGYDKADVKFRKLSDEEIAAYVESGLGLDKAGGYGIQDKFNLVEAIDGEYDTVVGLPSKKIVEILERVL